ncbi:TKL protein kinase, partial [Thecamonas trahens ATCC 50062]
RLIRSTWQPHFQGAAIPDALAELHATARGEPPLGLVRDNNANRRQPFSPDEPRRVSIVVSASRRVLLDACKGLADTHVAPPPPPPSSSTSGGGDGGGADTLATDAARRSEVLCAETGTHGTDWTRISYMPIAVSYIVPMVNVPGFMPGLVLDAELVAALWHGSITRWDDPRIAAVNPGLALPDHHVVLIRAILPFVEDLVVRDMLSVMEERGTYNASLFSNLPPNQVPFGTSTNVMYISNSNEPTNAWLALLAATRAIPRTPYSFTIVTSEAFVATGVSRDLFVATMIDGTGGHVQVSEQSVEVAASTLASPNVNVLLAPLPRAWPLTHGEWLAIPTLATKVPRETCELMRQTANGIRRALSSLIVSERAWLYGTRVVPSMARSALDREIYLANCNGEYIADGSSELIVGSGSPLAASALEQSVEVYNAMFGSRVEFSRSSSLDGLDELVTRRAVFASTELPPLENHLTARPGLAAVPFAAAAVVLPYVIPFRTGAPTTLTRLVLSRHVVADIYLGRVTQWADSQIVALNPELAPWLPNSTICIHVLTPAAAEMSGETRILLDALASFSSDAAALAQLAQAGDWPVPCLVEHSTMGALVYEFAFETSGLGYASGHMASALSLRFASLINAAGDVVDATPLTVRAAAANAVNVPATNALLPLVKTLVDQPVPLAWPLVGYTYWVFECSSTAVCAKRRAAFDYLRWALASSDTRALLRSLFFAPLTNATLTAVAANLATCTCGALPLSQVCIGPGCGASDEPVLSTGALAAAITVPLVVICVCALVAGIVLWSSRKHERVTVPASALPSHSIIIPSHELRIGNVIGTGSFGTVFEAQWRGSPVVVKRVREGQSGAGPRLSDLEFVAELMSLAMLRHPNIVMFMGADVEARGIVTEFLPRGSLHAILHNAEFNLPQSLLGWWMHCIALGVDFLHQAGAIHSDLKSPNILLDAGWVPKLADVGIPRIKAAAYGAHRPIAVLADGANTSRSPLHSRLSEVSMSEQGSIMPSPSDASFLDANAAKMPAVAGDNLSSLLWVAPEVVVDGEAGLSPAADVYAFGITMWEMLTRTEPYKGTHPVVAANDVAAAVRRPLLGLVPEWGEAYVPLMTAAWEHEPEERPSFSRLAAQLRGLYSRSSVVLPTTIARPEGHVVAALISVTENAQAVTAALEETHAALTTFHRTIGHLLQNAPEIQGRVADWTLTHVLVVFPLPCHFVAFTSKFLAALSGTRVEARVVAADGRIETLNRSLSRPFSGTYLAFRGPVVDELVSTTAPSAASGVFVAPGLGDAVEATLCALTASAQQFPNFSSDSMGEGTDGGTGSTRGSGSYTLSASRRGSGVSRRPRANRELPVSNLKFRKLLDVATPRVSRVSGELPRANGGGAEALGYWGVVSLVSEASPRIASGQRQDREAKIDSARGRGCARAETTKHMFANQTLSLPELGCGSPILIALPEMIRVLAHATEVGMGSFARICISDIDGQAVLVKLLSEQDLGPQDVVELVAAMASVFRMSHQSEKDLVVHPLAICPFKPCLGIIYPLVEHGSLAAAVDAGRVGGAFARRVAVALAETLASLHADNFVHGSVKPSNVMLYDSGGSRVTLTDAGLSALRGTLSVLSSTSSIIYSSPEVLAGSSADTSATDVFSYASTVYEVVTGQRAFTGESPLDVAQKIMAGNVPYGGCGPRLGAVLGRAWAPLAADRPTMAEVKDLIAALPEDEFCRV